MSLIDAERDDPAILQAEDEAIRTAAEPDMAPAPLAELERILSEGTSPVRQEDEG